MITSNIGVIASSISKIILVDYVMVAGGGGGGAGSGGGGGAGGYLSGTLSLASGYSTTLSVGAGGASGVSRSSVPTNGSNSTGFGLTSIGGGRGAANPDILNYVGGNGGSGGGGAWWNSNQGGQQARGLGTAGQGFNGGTATNYGGGGGGGAGAIGFNNSTYGVGGGGGVGIQSSITGVATFYAGGGGGGSGGVGGNGGGGTGGDANTIAQRNGVINTGGGGGGGNVHAGSVSGNGGRGIIIIAYPSSSPALTVGAGLTYTEPVRAGYRVYQFTAGAGTITF